MLGYEIFHGNILNSSAPVCNIFNDRNQLKIVATVKVVVVCACYGASFAAHVFGYLVPNFVSRRPA